MKCFGNLSIRLAVLLFGICCYTNTASALGNYAINPSVKFDGTTSPSLTISTVWQAIDPSTGSFEIQGAHGTATGPWTIVTLTDPTLVNTTNPVLATSFDSAATTKAVAVWEATEMSTGNNIVQVAVATSSGWPAASVSSPITLSLDDGTEIAQGNDHGVSISQDGTQIVVTWSAFLTGSQDVVIRASSSTDGGTTWSSPTTMSIL